jgi:hypothetical protein
MVSKTATPAHTPRAAHAPIPFGAAADDILSKLEGMKRRIKTGEMSFVDSPKNLALVRAAFPGIQIKLPIYDGPATQPDFPLGQYVSRSEPPMMGHQKEGFELSKDEEFFAYFMEQGTGKSRTAIEKIGYHFARGEITGVLIVTFKGIHLQWAMQQIPEHIGSVLYQNESQPRQIQYYIETWEGKPIAWPAQKRGRLEIFSTTFSGVTARKGKNLGEMEAHRFVDRHRGKLLMIVDESHAIKSYETERTESCIDLGLRSRFRLILSGSPVPASLEDEWSQSVFMHEKIFGYRYVVSFKADYVSADKKPKNIDQFRSLMAPYVFRVTKDDCLDLPPKIMERYTFDLGPRARKAYDELRTNFLTEVEHNGGVETVTVQNAAVLLLRLQQIASGILVNEDKTEIEIGSDRADAYAALLNKYEEQTKIITWCRFRRDLDKVTEALNKKGERYVILGGSIDQEARTENAKLFMDPSSGVKHLVSNPAVGGTGYNFQGECRTAIYYSNSFNSVHRWQSEDRIHRIGTIHPCSYVDMIARRTVDEGILRNLNGKKEFADLVLQVVKEQVF